MGFFEVGEGELERNTGREKIGYMVPPIYLANLFSVFFFANYQISPFPPFQDGFSWKKACFKT